MKKMLKVVLLCVVCSLTLICASCGKDERMTVGSVIFEATNEWFVEATAGMEDAAKQLNVNLSKSDSRYDVLVEKDLIREQIKNKASAVVICPLTVDETGAALKEATDLGIPVVTWNSVVKPVPTSQIVVDSTVLGSATGEYVKKYVQEKGIKNLKAALIIDTSFSVGIERCNGFRQSIKPLVDSGVMEIVVETKADMHEATSITIEKILNERPDINFIWCWNQMTTGAAVDVLKKLGRSDVIVTGTDMSLSLAGDMLANEVNLIAITTQQPYQMGYEAVQTAVKAAKGEKVEQTLIIPTMTYTKDDPNALNEYIASHQKYVKK